MVAPTGYTNFNEHSRSSSRKWCCRIGCEGAEASDKKDFVDFRIGEAFLASGRQSGGIYAEGKGAQTGSQDDREFWFKGVGEEAKMRGLWSSDSIRV